MNFSDLGLSAPILRAVTELGYQTPTPIQEKSIPSIIAGKDVLSAARTGTGKTAGFTLPILELLKRGAKAGPNQARALVLTPTRELAAQVAESVEKYGRYTELRSTVVFGGVKINPQMMRLRKGADILVATPGRLLDLYNQNAVNFSQLEILVLDEADRMLDMGFINDIRKILRILPVKRQNLMFSATFSDEIRALAKGLVHNPVEIAVSTANSAAPQVRQWLIPVDKKAKADVLLALIQEHKWHQVLVLTKTKHGANKLTKVLDAAGIKAAAIHGNKSQGARTKALADFKAGQVQILVATDIAARGLDIQQLPQVVNFDLPQVPEDYVHRIGRTGRAGATGQAVSLVAADEHAQLVAIERVLQAVISREYYDGFEPDHDVPSSRAPSPVKPKTANRPGSARPPQRNNNRNQNSSKPQRDDGRTKPSSGAKPAHAQARGSNRRPATTGAGNARPTSTGAAPWQSKK